MREIVEARISNAGELGDLEAFTQMDFQKEVIVEMPPEMRVSRREVTVYPY